MKTALWLRGLVCSALLLVVVAVHGPATANAAPCENTGVPGTPYEGFGSKVTGGAGKPIFHVTTTNASGTGSITEAVSSGNRCIVFDVAGTITLTGDSIQLKGPNVTIDGFTAPSPGITFRYHGFYLNDVNYCGSGCHANNVIIRGVRFRDIWQEDGCPRPGASLPGAIQIRYGAHDIVIDHVSADHGCSRALATQTAPIGSGIPPVYNILVSWTIMSNSEFGFLVGDLDYNATFHHNLFYNNRTRNPQCDWDQTLASFPTEIQMDVRNNLVYGYSGYGTNVHARCAANVINNVYYSTTRTSASQAVSTGTEGQAYVHGNVHGNGGNIDALSNHAIYSSASVTTTDACTAGYRVRDEAGARGPRFGLDSRDSDVVAQIVATLPGCGPPASVRTLTVR